MKRTAQCIILNLKTDGKYWWKVETDTFIQIQMSNIQLANPLMRANIDLKFEFTVAAVPAVPAVPAENTKFDEKKKTPAQN